MVQSINQPSKLQSNFVVSTLQRLKSPKEAEVASKCQTKSHLSEETIERYQQPKEPKGHDVPDEDYEVWLHSLPSAMDAGTKLWHKCTYKGSCSMNVLHNHWTNSSSFQSYNLLAHQSHVAPRREGSTPLH